MQSNDASLLPLIILVIIILIVSYIWSKIYFVPESMMMVTTIFRRYHRVCKSGFVFLWPFENPYVLAFHKSPYTSFIKEGIYLPYRFNFDPPKIAVGSKNSTPARVDPVMIIEVDDINKLYFSFPESDPFAFLVGKIEEIMNSICSKYDMIKRDHFNEIANATQEGMKEWCTFLGIKISNFRLQDLEITPERVALEKKNESDRRTKEMELENADRNQAIQMKSIEHEKLRVLQRIENEQAQKLVTIRAEQELRKVQMAAELSAAKHESEIAKLKAESELQLLKVLKEQSLLDAYLANQQVITNGKMTEAVIKGTHTTYVVDPSHSNFMFSPLMIKK